MHPLLSFGIRAGLSDLIPTNLESKDLVMDADYSLPDVSIQPNKPPLALMAITIHSGSSDRKSVV